MLNQTRDNVARRIAAKTKERQVIGLGSAAREDHFIGMRAKDGRRFLARIFQRLPRPSARLVRAGRIAVNLRHEWPHRLYHRRQHRRRRIVVEVDEIHKKSERFQDLELPIITKSHTWNLDLRFGPRTY